MYVLIIKIFSEFSSFIRTSESFIFCFTILDDKIFEKITKLDLFQNKKFLELLLHYLLFLFGLFG